MLIPFSSALFMPISSLSQTFSIFIFLPFFCCPLQTRCCQGLRKISYDGSDKKENKNEWHKRVRRGKTAKRQVHSDPVCVFVSSKSEIQMTSEWAIRPKFVSRLFDRLFWLLLTPQVQALDRQQNNSSNVWTPADLAARNTRREKKRNTHTFMCMYTPEKFFKHKLRPNCEESFRISP
jgi:hypothetical protein